MTVSRTAEPTSGPIRNAHVQRLSIQYNPDRHRLDRKGGICTGLGTIGCRPPPQTSGIDPSTSQEPGRSYRRKKSNSFLDLVAHELPDEFLGFRLAQSFDLRKLGLLYYVQASSETLGDALQRAARYCMIHNEGVNLTYRRTRYISMTCKYVGVARAADRHQIEFFVTALVRLCRQLTGRHLGPSWIKLMHRRTEVPFEFRTFFGCDVVFGSDIDEVAYPADFCAPGCCRRRSVSQFPFGQILRRSTCEPPSKVGCLAVKR